jgi:hypothetical protein
LRQERLPNVQDASPVAHRCTAGPRGRSATPQEIARLERVELWIALQEEGNRASDHRRSHGRSGGHPMQIIDDEALDLWVRT